MTAAQFLALPQHERARRAAERPAFYHAWDRPSSFAGASANRPVWSLTDAGGMALHNTTLTPDEVLPFLRSLVDAFCDLEEPTPAGPPPQGTRRRTGRQTRSERRLKAV